jgi:hypothetical protein
VNNGNVGKRDEARLPGSGADESPGVIRFQCALVVYKVSLAVLGKVGELGIVLGQSDKSPKLERIETFNVFQPLFLSEELLNDSIVVGDRNLD